MSRAPLHSPTVANERPQYPTMEIREKELLNELFIIIEILQWNGLELSYT